MEAKSDQTEPEPEVAAERKPKLHFRDLRRLAKSHIYKDVEVNKAELQVSMRKMVVLLIFPYGKRFLSPEGGLCAKD